MAGADTGGEGPGGGLSNHGRRAVRHVLWSGWSQIAVAALGLGWLFTIPRLFGPEQYGVFVLLSSLLDFHTFACSLGANNVFAYYLPHARQAGERQVGTLVSGFALLVMAAAIAGGGVMAAVAWQLVRAPQVTLLILLLLVVAGLQILSALLGGLLYGENRLALYSIRLPLQQAVTLPAAYVGYRLLGLPGAVGSLALGALVAIAVAAGGVRPWQYLQRPRWRGQDWPARLRFGLFSVFGLLGALTLTRGGNVVLSAVAKSPAEVAVFAVAVGFILQGSMLLASLGSALVPGLARLLAEGERERAEAWAERAARYQLIAAVVGVASVVFLGREFLAAAVGDRYPGLYLTTLCAILALAPLGHANLATQLAVAWGLPRVNLEQWAVLTGSFVVGVAGLGKLYGPPGAALGMVAAATAAAVFVAVRLRQLQGPRLWTPQELKLLALALPGFLLVALKGSAVQNALLLAAYLVSFVAGLLLLRVVSLRELRELRAGVGQGTAAG